MSRGNVIKYEEIGEKGKKGKGNPKKGRGARLLPGQKNRRSSKWGSASGLGLESAGRQGKGVE